VSFHQQYSVEALSKQCFVVNDFMVDPVRGELIKPANVAQLEPKVMAVLIFLTAHQGDVVDPEVLFAHVWPKSIYSPGSIRRCIAVLRKAFNDEAKAIIVTHPKRGYSLQAIIAEPESAKAGVEKVKTSPQKRLTYVALLIIVLVLVAYQVISLSKLPHDDNSLKSVNKVNQLNVKEILPLTATERYEYYSRYASDGKAIAFLRAAEKSENNRRNRRHIWLKNLQNDQEYQLTSTAENIISFTWSLDNKAILYAVRDHNNISIFRLSTKNLPGKKPAMKVLTRSNIQHITAIHWGVGNALYYIAKTNGIATLYSNNLTNGEQTPLIMSNDEFRPYELSLNYAGNQIAVLGFNKKMHSQVKVILLNHANQVTSAKAVPAAKSIATLDSNRYFISWHPNNANILLSDGRHLYNLIPDGQVKKIGFENYMFVRHPQFSPDGQSIALTLENSDVDILSHSLNQVTDKYKVVDSNTVDFQPRFSPSGDKFSFISARKGYPQLYVHDLSTGQDTLVFANPKQNLSIFPGVWHKSGNKLASATNEQPFIVEMTSTDIKVAMLSYTQGVPLQWYHNENALLLSNHNNDQRQFAKLDLSQQKLSPLLSQYKNFAYLNLDDELVIISNNQITKPMENPEFIIKIDGVVQRTFAASEGVYLQINKAAQSTLHYYAYQKEQITAVDTLSTNERIATISDQQQRILTTERKTKKDIVILSLSPD